MMALSGEHSVGDRSLLPFYEPTYELVNFLDVGLDVSFNLFDLIGVWPNSVSFE